MLGGRIKAADRVDLEVPLISWTVKVDDDLFVGEL